MSSFQKGLVDVCVRKKIIEERVRREEKCNSYMIFLSSESNFFFCLLLNIFQIKRSTYGAVNLVSQVIKLESRAG